MPLSRMENTTFAMPSIIDSHGVSLVGASLAEASQFLGVSRGTVSKVMTQPDKTSSAKQSSGQKEKLIERNRLVLKLIIMSTAAEVTAEYNVYILVNAKRRL
ncbi:hypothetical protein TNCV_1894151 [Trichonephila clavipes]|nr:hypothetical protein TNCV_1894151 [Trichonephila clavipes]